MNEEGQDGPFFGMWRMSKEPVWVDESELGVLEGNYISETTGAGSEGLVGHYEDLGCYSK